MSYYRCCQQCDNEERLALLHNDDDYDASPAGIAAAAKVERQRANDERAAWDAMADRLVARDVARARNPVS